ncbi:peroxiredoxin family protein [Myxococcota bacterium]|nr:peroxiredoxin family protein [Myxococcota bacterium]
MHADLEGAAPLFELPDVRGGRVALEEVLKSSRAVLVFYRGGWCPICNAQLAKLSAAYEAFRDRGAEILAISNERVREGREVLRKVGPPYPLLLDEDGEVIRAYALEVTRRDPLGWVLRKQGYAHPAVFVVDPDGRIAWRYVGRHYRDRPSVDLVLQALDGAVAQAGTAGSEAG